MGGWVLFILVRFVFLPYDLFSLEHEHKKRLGLK